jgi:UDP-N-acetylmuramate--alanine ligase
VITIGVDRPADLRAVDLRATDGGTTFTVERDGDLIGEVALRIPGRHYVIDALAALATGLELGHDFSGLAAGLAEFVGTGRRMELKGTAGGARVYDSYAHHPTEIRGDIEAARSLAGDERVVVCFQPHLVSRTRIFGAEMGEALGGADEVVVLDVYVAREEPDPEVSGALVADAVPLPAQQVRYVPQKSDALEVLLGIVRSGDVVLTLGAGDVTALAPELLARLEERADG